MEFDIYNVTIIVIILLLTSVTFAYKIYKNKKQQPEKELSEIILEKIRPELLNALKEVVKFKAVKDYETFEKTCIEFLMERIDDLDILNEGEKEFFTEDLIKLVVSPYLIQLWNQKK